jgi:hypothetical protein
MVLPSTMKCSCERVVGSESGEIFHWARLAKTTTLSACDIFAVLMLSRFRASYVAAVECMPGGCRPLSQSPHSFVQKRRRENLVRTEMVSTWPCGFMLRSANREG